MLQAVIAVGHLSINEFTLCSILRYDAMGELSGRLEKRQNTVYVVGQWPDSLPRKLNVQGWTY